MVGGFCCSTAVLGLRILMSQNIVQIVLRDKPHHISQRTADRRLSEKEGNCSKNQKDTFVVILGNLWGGPHNLPK